MKTHLSVGVIDLPLFLIAGVRFTTNNKIKVDPDKIDLSSGNLKPPLEEDPDLSRERDAAIEIMNKSELSSIMNEIKCKSLKGNYWEDSCKKKHMKRPLET